MFNTFSDFLTELSNIGLECDLSEIDSTILDSEDFELDSYRFIRADRIDEILLEELQSDEYLLGCFKASFLAEVTELPIEVFEALQSAEAYRSIGKLLIALDCIESLAEKYVQYDGYGHHFAHYDGYEHEICINSTDYYVFRIN